MRKAIIRNPRVTHQKMSPKLFKLWNDNGKSFPNWSDFGGYPLYYVYNTGEVVCGKHATEEAKGEYNTNDAKLVDVDINYEDPDLWCEHGHRIESAYAEDEAVENPRKVTKRSVEAFGKRERYQEGNTTTDSDTLYLHGNAIAQWRSDGLWITNAGWATSTTKERLNGLPDVQVYQSKGQWYLNGKPWNGEWVSVSEWNATRNPVRNSRTSILPDSYAGTSVSWGTLNPEHLIDAFIDFLEMTKRGNRQVLANAKKELKRLKKTGTQTDETGFVLEELFDAIEKVAPKGTTFGAHEGDGSDFGFWQYEDWD